MTTNVFERLLNNTKVRVVGALDSALKLELFNVVEEFLRTSSVWREDTAFDTDTGVFEYPIFTDESAEITQLIALVNGSGVPVPATMEEPGTLILVNPPAQAETLTATVALTISDPVSRAGYPNVPGWIVTKYREALTDGLIARMMSQPAKPYTNVTLAAYHMKRYRDVMARARGEASRKNLYGAQCWKFPTWA